MTLTDRVLFPALVALAATLGLLLIAAPSKAGCNYFGSSYSYAYAAPAYYEAPKVEVKKVVAVEYLAVPVVVPAYAVGYAAQPAPAAAPAQPLPCEERTRSLEAKLAALEARLSAGAPPQPPPLPLPPQAPPQPPPMAPVGNGKSVVVGRCGNCHDAAMAAAKGGKLTLTDRGAVIPLSPEVVNRCLKEMLGGHMPKGGTLTDQEFTGALQELLGASK